MSRRILEFCDLLADSVDGGASIGFLPPLRDGEAEAYWRSVNEALSIGERILVVAEDSGTLVGCVQLDLAQRANASHRAEVMKLMVHRSQRRRGLGKLLMSAVEEAAAQAGRCLLILDTRKGDPSVELYRGIGYHEAGEIPYYARSSSGELHSTIFFWKMLR